MAYILEYINHEFNGSIRDGNFYDLGSGLGKPVIAMSLLCHFKKLIGIEYLDNLFKLSLSIKQSYENTIEEKFRQNKDLFTLRVSGESMINVGIYDGDILIVERRNTARNGETVVAMNENNEATVKTFYKEDGYFRLQPENDTMEPIILKECTILGKVIGLYRKL